MSKNTNFLTFSKYLKTELSSDSNSISEDYDNNIINLINNQNKNTTEKNIIIDNLDNNDEGSFIDLNFDRNKCTYNFKNNFLQNSPDIKRISMKIKNLEHKYKTSLQKVEEEINEISLYNSKNKLVQTSQEVMTVKINNLLQQLTKHNKLLEKIKKENSEILKNTDNLTRVHKVNLKKLIKINNFLNK